MAYPGPYYPAPYPTPYPTYPPRPSRPVWDIVVTVVLGVLLLGACALGALYSMFAVMATAVCSGTDRCNFDLVNTAYLVAWGGIGVALLVALVGGCIAAARRRIVVGWPMLGWVIFLTTYIAGGFLLNAGVGN